MFTNNTLARQGIYTRENNVYCFELLNLINHGVTNINRRSNTKTGMLASLHSHVLDKYSYENSLLLIKVDESFLTSNSFSPLESSNLIFELLPSVQPKELLRILLTRANTCEVFSMFLPKTPKADYFTLGIFPGLDVIVKTDVKIIIARMKLSLPLKACFV